MSEPLEINYKDYKVQFSEFSDEWRCFDLGLSATSLTALKKKIADWDLVARRLGSLPLIEVSSYGSAVTKVIGVTIADDGEVWCKLGKTRRKIALSKLINDTDDNIKNLLNAAAFDVEAEKLNNKAITLRASIPRVTKAELQAIAGENLDKENAA